MDDDFLGELAGELNRMEKAAAWKKAIFSKGEYPEQYKLNGEYKLYCSPEKTSLSGNASLLERKQAAVIAALHRDIERLKQDWLRERAQILKRSKQVFGSNKPDSDSIKTANQIAYQAFLNSPEWHEYRKAIYLRDPICTVCWSSPTENCHHVKYDAPGKWLPHDTSLVIGVCEKCHEYLHAKHR